MQGERALTALREIERIFDSHFTPEIEWKIIFKQINFAIWSLGDQRTS